MFCFELIELSLFLPVFILNILARVCSSSFWHPVAPSSSRELLKSNQSVHLNWMLSLPPSYSLAFSSFKVLSILVIQSFLFLYFLYDAAAQLWVIQYEVSIAKRCVAVYLRLILIAFQLAVSDARNQRYKFLPHSLLNDRLMKKTALQLHLATCCLLDLPVTLTFSFLIGLLQSNFFFFFFFLFQSTSWSTFWLLLATVSLPETYSTPPTWRRASSIAWSESMRAGESIGEVRICFSNLFNPQTKRFLLQTRCNLWYSSSCHLQLNSIAASYQIQDDRYMYE